MVEHLEEALEEDSKRRRSQDEIMRRTLEGLQKASVRIASDENPVDLKCAEYIVLVYKQEEKSQLFLDELTKVIPYFGKHFAPTKCEGMLVDMQSLNTPLSIYRKRFEVMGLFKYIRSCINSDYSMTNEVNARIREARVAFANMRHIWPQSGIFLNLKRCPSAKSARPTCQEECRSDLSVNCASGSCSRTTMALGLLPVTLRGPRGVCTVNALVDSGSDSTMLKEDVALTLGLSGLSTNISVATLNGQNEVSTTRASFGIDTSPPAETSQSVKAWTVRQLPSIMEPCQRESSGLSGIT
ncbi:polyprotein [Clonorchis sinensis]|uniref:Polyprotein n=1 Tax=Clonorchis sinensis TaxID=79923 RepID=G7YBU7_CLOSI|nr:polyprotein [Clonorchis sinensis]